MLLCAINVSKEYSVGSTRLEVLKGVSLGIEKGQIVGIVGPSGAGKSTLLHLLGGLDRPTRGSVTLEGQDLLRLSDKKLAQVRNQRFGFVFQFYHLLAEFTALENVMLPALLRQNKGRRVLSDTARELLERCGLGKRLRHRPSELSGGEQQRVAIARALMNRPEILFCDEPTGNLDSETGRQIRQLVWQFNQEYKTTVIIVTHSRELVRQATRIISLQDGVIIP